MSARANQKRWSEFASIVIAVIAITLVFFEMLRAHLPRAIQITIEHSSGHLAIAFLAAIGFSLVCTGIGVMSISGVRLLLATRQEDAPRLYRVAKDHLVSVCMVSGGFFISVCAMYVLSRF